MSYSCYDDNRQVKTQVYDNGRSMTLGEITDILNAFDRLSPSTRRLLIERPEAVEKAVRFAKAQWRWNSHHECKRQPTDDIEECPTCSELVEELINAENEACSAIALLPEETT